MTEVINALGRREVLVAVLLVLAGGILLLHRAFRHERDRRCELDERLNQLQFEVELYVATAIHVEASRALGEYNEEGHLARLRDFLQMHRMPPLDGAALNRAVQGAAMKGWKATLATGGTVTLDELRYAYQIGSPHDLAEHAIRHLDSALAWVLVAVMASGQYGVIVPHLWWKVIELAQKELA